MEQGPAPLWEDAGQGRQGLRIMTRTQAQRVEFRAKLGFLEAVERQSGKLRLKVRCKDLIHRAGKLLLGDHGVYF